MCEVVPVDNERPMTFLPFLAVGLAISVIIMVIFRVWEGWKTWKDSGNTITLPIDRGSDGLKTGPATLNTEESDKAQALFRRVDSLSLTDKNR